MVDFPSAAELDIFAAETTGDYGSVPSQLDDIQKMRVREIDIQTQQPRIDSQELGQGRDPTPQAAGRKSTTVNILANHRNLVVAPAAGSPPDQHVLFKTLFGNGAFAPSPPAWRYTPKRVQEGQCALYTHNSDSQEVNLGVALSEGVLSWDGVQPTTWRFTGFGKDAHEFTPFTLSAGNLDDLDQLVGVGNIVKVGSANSGIVTAVTPGTNFAQGATRVTAGVVADAFDAAPLNALAPNQNAALPHVATAGGFWYADAAATRAATLGGKEILHTSGEIRFSPGVTLINDQVGTDGPTGVGSPNIRQVSLTLTLRVRPEDVRFSNDVESNPAKLFACAVSLEGVSGRGITSANAADRRAVVYMPNVQFVPAVKRRQLGQYDTLTLTGTAVGVGAANSIELYLE